MGLNLLLYTVVNVLRLVEERNKMFSWMCCRVDKLKIILSRDLNAVTFPNMNQSTSSESGAAFMAQNNIYSRDDFPMQERNIIPGSSAARTNSNTRITQNTAAAGTC